MTSPSVKTMQGPVVETGSDRTIRWQDRFELEEEQNGTEGASTVYVSADLFWEHVSEYDDRGLIWARGTGIKLQRESIPALIALLSRYLADAAVQA